MKRPCWARPTSKSTLPESVRNQAKLAVRDEYTFDFLELGEEHSERELERAIIARIEQFLREMGGMFAFMGSQYRLEIDGDEFFIDLLLYHRILKCLVAVELKITEFKPEYVGKMQFYLAALDDRVRLPDENPSIGMILCRTKKRAVVEYALRESNKPIGVAAYRIVRRLPAELKGKLPEPAQIQRLLEAVELPKGKRYSSWRGGGVRMSKNGDPPAGWVLAKTGAVELMVRDGNYQPG